MTIHAALLDANGVFLRIDELASEADLTPRHLAAITTCDLAPGEYKWVPDDANPYGGAFWNITWLKKQADTLALSDIERRKQAQQAQRSM